MKNPPAVKIGIIIAFIQIAIQFLFLYTGMNGSLSGAFSSVPLSIFCVVAYLITIYFLRATLIYFDEKQSIVNAFSIYLGLNIVLFLVNTAVIYLVKDNHLLPYIITLYYVVVLYIAVQSFRVSQPVIKSGFALFAVFLLIVTFGNLALPAVFNFFNVDSHLYRYIHFVSMLPLIGAIIIFNSVANSEKAPGDFIEKPLLKNDPF
jgi:hypothetical protein